MSKKIIFVSLLICLILVSACQKKINEEIPNKDVSISYGGGKLYYSIIVEKPTPCYNIELTKQMDSDKINLKLKLIPPSPGVFCTEMIAYDDVNGELELQQKPSYVSVTLEDEVIYASSNIPDKQIFQGDCIIDDDCACGVDKIKGNCAIGNKTNIDTSKQCPDFCSGIAGNFQIKCLNNKCSQVRSDLPQ